MLKVVDTKAEEGAIVSELKLSGQLLCSPAISDGKIYVRSDQTLWQIGAN
jgi:hypothetical protein